MCLYLESWTWSARNVTLTSWGHGRGRGDTGRAGQRCPRGDAGAVVGTRATRDSGPAAPLVQFTFPGEDGFADAQKREPGARHGPRRGRLLSRRVTGP